MEAAGAAVGYVYVGQKTVGAVQVRIRTSGGKGKGSCLLQERSGGRWLVRHLLACFFLCSGRVICAIHARGRYVVRCQSNQQHTNINQQTQGRSLAAFEAGGGKVVSRHSCAAWKQAARWGLSPWVRASCLSAGGKDSCIHPGEDPRPPNPTSFQPCVQCLCGTHTTTKSRQGRAKGMEGCAVVRVVGRRGGARGAGESALTKGRPS